MRIRHLISNTNDIANLWPWTSHPRIYNLTKTQFRSSQSVVPSHNKTQQSTHHVHDSWDKSLRWRHNERGGVSNRQPHECLPTVYSGSDQRKHQSSASLVFVRGIHRWPVNSPHKGPATRKMFPFDDVIILFLQIMIRHQSLFIINNYNKIFSLSFNLWYTI